VERATLIRLQGELQKELLCTPLNHFQKLPELNLRLLLPAMVVAQNPLQNKLQCMQQLKKLIFS
jgi:hypothetical protein